MARNDPPPTSVDPAAHKSRQPTSHDRPGTGSGTPWEDRGERGMVNAFFANTFRCLRWPMRLLASIRRPETTSDALSYPIGCGLLCSVAWVINSLTCVYALHKPHEKPADLLNQEFFVGTVLQFLIAPVAIWAMVKFASFIYFNMASGELRGRLQSALIFNVFSYSMAPCLVALIPFIGPPLALIWITGILIAAGRSRIRLSPASAIVDAILSVLGVVLPAIGAYFLLWWLFKFLWNLWFGI
jgi:hypothetical protein